MFTLTLDRPTYIRIKKGITEADIRAEFVCPVLKEIFSGAVIKIPSEPCGVYVAAAGDDYAKISAKLGADERELRSLNGNSPVYPSKKVYFIRQNGVG